jgi:hypothetical protein
MGKTYAEAIASRWEGKIVEIHTGDTRHSQQYVDYTINKKSIIRGKIIAADGDAIVINCLLKNGNTTEAIINGWNIFVITEYNPGTNITDIYRDEDER